MTDRTLPRPDRPAPRILFDVVLLPHRSLSPAGFALLMVLISGVSFVSGVFFALKGAWPITGFFALDALLLYFAFRASYRSARVYETVRLTENALVVVRAGPTGALRRWTFQPYWLRVQMDDPPKHDSQLTLSSHGRALVIGSFLSPAERLEVAEALRVALRRWRSEDDSVEWRVGSGVPSAG
jgi:uncharacterized membrane protein